MAAAAGLCTVWQAAQWSWRPHGTMRRAPLVVLLLCACLARAHALSSPSVTTYWPPPPSPPRPPPPTPPSPPPPPPSPPPLPPPPPLSPPPPAPHAPPLLPAGVLPAALSTGSSWGVTAALGAVPLMSFTQLLHAPPGQQSAARVLALALVQLLDSSTDLLYLTGSLWSSGVSFRLAQLFYAAPVLWYFACLSKVKLSRGRLWSLVLYGDPHSDDTLRSITPLMALEREAGILRERERIHWTWWHMCAPVLLPLRAVQRSLDAALVRAEHSRGLCALLGGVRTLVRATAFIVVTALLPLALAVSGAAGAAYALLLGPLLLKLELLSSASVANRFFLRAPHEALDEDQLSFLFQTRGMSHALLESVPQAVITLTNAASLSRLGLPGYTPLAMVSLACSAASFAAHSLHWMSSWLRFREQDDLHWGVRDAFAKNMANWARPMLGSAPPPGTALVANPLAITVVTPMQSLAGVPASPKAFRDTVVDLSAGSEYSPRRISLAAISDAPAPPAPAADGDGRRRLGLGLLGRSRSLGVCDRHNLQLADVRRGALVELKPGSPERFREDAPGTVLLAGARGEVDEDAPCMNPYIVWERGQGRVFFHISDLFLLQPRRGGRALPAPQEELAGAAVEDVAGPGDDEDGAAAAGA